MFQMPMHIDVLVEEFRCFIAYNNEAIVTGDRYFAKHGGENFYSLYRLHDFHSLFTPACQQGRRSSP